jgi:hypothetical protein
MQPKDYFIFFKNLFGAYECDHKFQVACYQFGGGFDENNTHSNQCLVPLYFYGKPLVLILKYNLELSWLQFYTSF